MKHKSAFLVALLVWTTWAGTAAFAQTNLANLGNTNFNILITNNAGVTQTTTDLAFAPQALGGIFGGSFTNAYNWNAYNDTNIWTFGLFLTVPVGSPNGTFTVELFNSAFDLVAKYQGATDTAGATLSFVSMTRAAGGSGDFAQIGGFQMTWDTDTTGNLTIAGVGVVPAGPIEPLITSTSYADGDFTLTWSGTGALPVIVQRRESLETGQWIAIAQGLATGTYTDTDPPPDKAFYRVVVP